MTRMVDGYYFVGLAHVSETTEVNEMNKQTAARAVMR